MNLSTHEKEKNNPRITYPAKDHNKRKGAHLLASTKHGSLTKKMSGSFSYSAQQVQMNALKELNNELHSSQFRVVWALA